MSKASYNLWSRLLHKSAHGSAWQSNPWVWRCGDTALYFHRTLSLSIIQDFCVSSSTKKGVLCEKQLLTTLLEIANSLARLLCFTSSSHGLCSQHWVSQLRSTRALVVSWFIFQLVIHWHCLVPQLKVLPWLSFLFYTCKQGHIYPNMWNRHLLLSLLTQQFTKGWSRHTSLGSSENVTFPVTTLNMLNFNYSLVKFESFVLAIKSQTLEGLQLENEWVSDR